MPLQTYPQYNNCKSQSSNNQCYTIQTTTTTMANFQYSVNLCLGALSQKPRHATLFLTIVGFPPFTDAAFTDVVESDLKKYMTVNTLRSC